MTDKERLIRDIGCFQQQALRELADMEESEGNDSLAKGYRWLAENCKWPERVNEGRYDWYYTEHGRYEADLPLSFGNATQIHHRSRVEALKAAALDVAKWLEEKEEE